MTVSPLTLAEQDTLETWATLHVAEGMSPTLTQRLAATIYDYRNQVDSLKHRDRAADAAIAELRAALDWALGFAMKASLYWKPDDPDWQTLRQAESLLPVEAA